MKKMTLEFVGMDNFSTPVYKNEDGQYFKDINCDRGSMYLCTASDIDEDPDTPIDKIEKYRNLEIEIIGRENEPTKEEKFNYMILSRLKMDCDYFLGNGNRCVKHLYHCDVESQIKAMKELYDGFDDKPEWLTYEEILDYEKRMVIKEER